MSIGQTFRNLGRTREIISTLVKYGFEDLVASSTLRNFVPEGSRVKWLRQNKPALNYSRYERIRMCAEELGPTFVKLAQILSIRPDIIPEELIKELEKLQDSVPPFSFDLVQNIIRSETNKEIDEIFDYFNEKPLASASIGQVHRARLKTGEEVVVKIQRPGVRDLIERDLSIMVETVNRTERYLKKQGMLNPMDVVKTFERSILKELDYNNEGRNIEKFRNFYAGYDFFYIPKAYKPISTEKMLVIEYAEGCKINDVKKLKEWGLNPHKIAENGMAIYLTQIFEYGYFHADPHPGNVLVRKDGVICLIDFGMIGKLMPKDKTAFAMIFISIANQDAEKMGINLKRLAISDNIEDNRAFQYELNELIEDYADLDVNESSIADMTNALQKIMYNYQISVPGSIFLIFRALAILEGIGKQIHPNFQTYDFIKPYGKKIVEKQFTRGAIVKELGSWLETEVSMLRAIPRDTKQILNKIRKGKLHFEVEHQGYGYLLKKMDSLVNRMIISLVICALLITSGILAIGEHDPQYIGMYGLPYASLAGLSVSGFLFVIMAYAIMRRRKYK